MELTAVRLPGSLPCCLSRSIFLLLFNVPHVVFTATADLVLVQRNFSAGERPQTAYDLCRPHGWGGALTNPEPHFCPGRHLQAQFYTHTHTHTMCVAGENLCSTSVF